MKLHKKDIQDLILIYKVCLELDDPDDMYLTEDIKLRTNELQLQTGNEVPAYVFLNVIKMCFDLEKPDQAVFDILKLLGVEVEE